MTRSCVVPGRRYHCPDSDAQWNAKTLATLSLPRTALFLPFLFQGAACSRRPRVARRCDARRSMIDPTTRGDSGTLNSSTSAPAFVSARSDPRRSQAAKVESNLRRTPRTSSRSVGGSIQRRAEIARAHVRAGVHACVCARVGYVGGFD